MLRKQIISDQLAALKSGDKSRLSVLRLIVAQIKYKEIEKKAELDDGEVVSLIKKEIQQAEESKSMYEKAGREESVAEYVTQIDIMTSYLPPQLEDDQIEERIKTIAANNADAIAANPKAIIGLAMKNLKSEADSARITAALKKLEYM